MVKIVDRSFRMRGVKRHYSAKRECLGVIGINRKRLRKFFFYVIGAIFGESFFSFVIRIPRLLRNLVLGDRNGRVPVCLSCAVCSAESDADCRYRVTT